MVALQPVWCCAVEACRAHLTPSWAVGTHAAARAMLSSRGGCPLQGAGQLAVCVPPVPPLFPHREEGGQELASLTQDSDWRLLTQLGPPTGPPCVRVKWGSARALGRP